MSGLLLLLFITADVPAPAAPAPGSRADAYFHFSLALQARLSGDRTSALEELRRALALDPGSGEIRAELARMLRESGRLEDAVGEAEKAVQVAPDSVEAHRVLAQLYQAQADFGGVARQLGRAADEFESVLKLLPDDRSTLAALGQLYSRLQRNEDAIRIWRRIAELEPGSFEAYQRLGAHYLALGRAEDAARALKEALEIEPDSSRARQSLGDTYAQADKLDDAIEQYRVALEIEPGSLLVRLKLGEVLLRDGKAAAAVDEADHILATDSTNRYALDMKGRALRDLRRYDEAEKVVERLRGIDPTDLKAGFLQVTIAEARRDYEQAVELLQALVGRDRQGEEAAESATNDRVFLLHLGFAFEQLERHDEAADAFGRARAAAGDGDGSLYAYRIEALLQGERLDDALAEVRAARNQFPDRTDLIALEATVLEKRGQVKAALELIEELAAREPPTVEALLTVAQFHQRARRYVQAAAALERARTLDPHHLPTLFQLGAVLERLERYEEAEASFRQALEQQPDSAPVLNYLGYMNADRGVRLDEAFGMIRRALDLDPENGAYLDSLGWALFRMDRVGEAETYVRRALEKDSENAVILDHLGDILEKLGSLQEALTTWRSALDGKDEDGELDRVAVEQKIREAQATLDAARAQR